MVDRDSGNRLAAFPVRMTLKELVNPVIRANLLSTRKLRPGGRSSGWGRRGYPDGGPDDVMRLSGGLRRPCG